MKDKKSVWMLIAHSSIYKVVAVIAAAIAVQGIMFWLELSKDDITYGELRALEQVIDDAHMLWICAGGFLIVTAVLCLTGCEFGNRAGYTLSRLAMTERELFASQIIYNALCYVIFWAGQVVSTLICSLLYLRFADANVVNDQVIFLTFYQNDFWHNLLPMADVSRMVRNLVLVIALGIGTAAVPVFQRRRRMPLVIVVLIALIVMYFTRHMGDLTNDMLVIAIAGAAAVRGIVAVKDCLKEELP